MIFRGLIFYWVEINVDYYINSSLMVFYWREWRKRDYSIKKHYFPVQLFLLIESLKSGDFDKQYPFWVNMLQGDRSWHIENCVFNTFQLRFLKMFTLQSGTLQNIQLWKPAHWKTVLNGIQYTVLKEELDNLRLVFKITYMENALAVYVFIQKREVFYYH